MELTLPCTYRITRLNSSVIVCTTRTRLEPRSTISRRFENSKVSVSRNSSRCASVGRRYPPALDAELDGADAGLSTLKTQSLEGVEGGGEGKGKPDGEEEEEEEHRVLPSTKEERREAKRKLKEEEKKLKVFQMCGVSIFGRSDAPTPCCGRGCMFFCVTLDRISSLLHTNRLHLFCA